MTKIVLEGISIKGYAQSQNIEIEALQSIFAGGGCRIQYDVKPESAPTPEGEEPVVLDSIRNGFIDLEPPPQLLAAIEAWHKAIGPVLAQRLA